MASGHYGMIDMIVSPEAPLRKKRILGRTAVVSLLRHVLAANA
jgi:hypothetical protein